MSDNTQQNASGPPVGKDLDWSIFRAVQNGHDKIEIVMGMDADRVLRCELAEALQFNVMGHIDFYRSYPVRVDPHMQRNAFQIKGYNNQIVGAGFIDTQ